MYYYWHRTTRFFKPILEFRYFLNRIRRILTADRHMSLVERAKLKCDMGLKWTNDESEAMRKQIESTIVPCPNGDSCIYCNHNSA